MKSPFFCSSKYLYNPKVFRHGTSDPATQAKLAGLIGALAVAVTILDRWVDHVRGWVIDAPEPIRQKINYIRFEDLKLDFNSTIQTIGQRLNKPCSKPIMPSLNKNVVLPGKGRISGYEDVFNKEDLAYIKAKLDAPMKQFLYSK